MHIDTALARHQRSTQCSEPLSLQAARRDANPLSRMEAIAELGRCLTLCAPSGMSSDERGTWLAAAWAEVQDMPAAAFVSACAEARKVVEHPAKLVPTIIRCSEPFASQLRRKLVRAEAEWANRNAPRLTVVPGADEADDRAEVAEMMRGLVEKLSANQADRDE